jgi:hypothetical protein
LTGKGWGYQILDYHMVSNWEGKCGFGHPSLMLILWYCLRCTFPHSLSIVSVIHLKIRSTGVAVGD